MAESEEELTSLLMKKKEESEKAGLKFSIQNIKIMTSSPMATAEFSKFAGILSAALSQHHFSRFEIAQLEFHHLH